jgi:hypothetical protein
MFGRHFLRLATCSLCLLFCAAVWVSVPLSAQPIINSQQVWGDASDGLRMSISTAKSGATPSKEVAVSVGFQNVGSKDFVLNLGRMLGNGQEQVPSAIRITLSDAKGQPRGFLWSRRPAIAGRMDDFIVALPAGATYVLGFNLEEHCTEKLSAGRYRITASFEGKVAIHANDASGIRQLHFWMGAIQANTLDFEISDRRP